MSAIVSAIIFRGDGRLWPLYADIIGWVDISIFGFLQLSASITIPVAGPDCGHLFSSGGLLPLPVPSRRTRAVARRESQRNHIGRLPATGLALTFFCA